MNRSASLPAIGAISAVATGQGVSRSPGGGRRKAEPVLEEEGQGHDGESLRAERADRRRERQREHRPA